jgi:hypothetical protein
MLSADNPARSYGSYIKLIHLKFHVPSNWQGIYTRYLIRLFLFCSNLETFINSPQFLEVRPPCAIPDGVIRTLTDSCCHSLRNVTFGGDEGPRLDELNYLLTNCSKTELLSTTSIRDEHQSTDLSSNSNLRSLRVHQEFYSPVQPIRISRIPSVFPSLNHISLINYFWGAEELRSFFEQCGPKLTSLYWESEEAIPLPAIIAYCPNLVSFGYDHRTHPLPLLTPQSGTNITELWIHNFPQHSNTEAMDVTHQLPRFQMENLGSYPNLGSIHLVDRTVDELCRLASTIDEVRHTWLQYTSYFGGRGILLLDANGEHVDTELFTERVGIEDPLHSDDEEYIYESQSDTKSQYSSDEEQVDSDYARRPCQDSSQVSGLVIKVLQFTDLFLFDSFPSLTVTRQAEDI